MRKIALVNPKVPSINSTAPPFGLMSLKAYVEDIADVKIIDSMAGQNIVNELYDFQPDWVGISVLTPSAYEAYRIADWVKRNYPQAKVVLGGIHVSMRLAEAIKHADHVVDGEGEIVFRQLIKGGINEPVIKGIPLNDLDEVPLMPWEAIDFEFYVQTDTPFPLDNLRTMNMITSRGCPFKCIFCWNSVRRSPVRFNSAERVCFEVDNLVEKYNINSIMFADDEFLINRKRLLKMCEHFKDVGFVWGCQARATTITDKIARLLSKSGCSFVGIGMESGNQRVLNILKSGSVTVEKNIKAIHILKKHGLTVLGGFILGTPSETYQEIMDTINFIIEQPFDSPGVFNLTPYPASTLWNIVKDKLENVDYSLLIPSTNPSVVLCDTMDKGDYKRILKYTANVAKFKRGLHLSKLRHRSWVRMFLRHPFYPYFLARHPCTAVKIMRNT